MQSSRDKRIPKAVVTTTTTWINCFGHQTAWAVEPDGAWLEYFSFFFFVVFFYIKPLQLMKKYF